MVVPSTASIVIIPFPFSDLSATKLRPAIIIADAVNNDWILAQITSKSYADKRALLIEQPDFIEGGLNFPSFVRPGKLFTANQNLFHEKIGLIKPEKFQEILSEITKLINGLTS